ncbi:MAG TPA: hypothetical protein PLV92_24910, partial [Pirellulaceae bacterium]|nr:hypothetical protein [Pirellulaceae bacterium]
WPRIGVPRAACSACVRNRDVKNRRKQLQNQQVDDVRTLDRRAAASRKMTMSRGGGDWPDSCG